MAAPGADLSTVQVRLRNAVYLYPIQRRIVELTNILAECNMKDLQIFFPFFVEHIFGVNPSYGNGWNLLKIYRHNNVAEFEVLFRFFNPFGPFFDIIYRLLSDAYLKYEYPLTFLSPRLKQIILEGSIPPFYVDKLQIDPNLREPTGLLLNPFEFYLFHFSYHLINPWQSQIDSGYYGGHETVYLHLSDQYMQHFLPIETSVVLPIVSAHQTMQLPRSPPPPQIQPQKTPKLFKNSLVKLGSASLSPTTVSQSHAENWRTEAFVQIIINFWLSVPEQSINSNPFTNVKSNGQSRKYNRVPVGYGPVASFPNLHYCYYYGGVRNSDNFLPKEDHLRVVRNMIKHIHYFVNNVHNDGSPMDELRKTMTSLWRRPLYTFLRRQIYHWPLDSSFLLLLETYLSFIQPWRYIKYNPGGYGESNQVDHKWYNFIVENFPAYTVIIREIIPRFFRMDLTSPKYAHMLFRLCKVLGQPNLAKILKEIEGYLNESNTSGNETPTTPLGTPKSPCSPGTPNSLNQSNPLSFPMFNRLNVIIRQEIQELESPNFQYQPLFGPEFHNQVIEFMQNVHQALNLVRYLLNSTLAERQQRRSNIFQRIRENLFYSNSDDYTVDERQKTITYLEHSVQLLTQVFDLPSDIQAPEYRNGDVSGSSVNSSTLGSGVLEPTVINPKDWQKRTRLIRYESNPDLEPIRSTEFTFLVRFFHQMSTRINERYEETFKKLWEREDFWGSVARQLLAPPCKYYYFDKSDPGNFAPRVPGYLPPRVSLRTLASHQPLFYIALSGLVAFLFGYPVIPFYAFMFFLFVCLIFAKAFFDQFFNRRRSSPARPTLMPQQFVSLDNSFTD